MRDAVLRVIRDRGRLSAPVHAIVPYCQNANLLRAGRYAFFPGMILNADARGYEPGIVWMPGTPLFQILWQSLWGIKRRRELLEAGNSIIERNLAGAVPKAG